MNKIFVSSLIFSLNSFNEKKAYVEKYGLKNMEFFIEFFEENSIENLEKFLSLNFVNKSFHGPHNFFNLACENEFWNENKVQFENAILFCKKYKGEYIVLHTNEKVENCFVTKEIIEKRILELVSFSKQQNVKIAVENTGIHENMIYGEKEYIDLIKRLELFSVLDIGHALINNWNLEHVISSLKTHIISYHLSNNFGKEDSHNCIFNGIFNIQEVLQLIKKHTPFSNIVLEYSETVNKEDILKTINFIKAENE